MKKIIILITVLFFFKTSFSQYPNGIQTIGNDSNVVQAKGGFRGRVINWTYTDTTAANLERIKGYPGAQIFTTADTALWFRSPGANKWIQMFSNTGGASGDTLVWKLSGNTVGSRQATPVLGTLDGYDLNLMTDGSTRLVIPQLGITRNTAAVNKYLLMDTITKRLYYGDGGSGSSYTFTNGLTESGGTVKLGGTLVNNTTINSTGNELLFNNATDGFTSRFRQQSNGMIRLVGKTDALTGDSAMVQIAGEDLEAMLYVLDSTNGITSRVFVNSGNEAQMESGRTDGSASSNISAFTTYVELANSNVGAISSMKIQSDSLTLKPHLGQIYIDTLQATDTTEFIVGYRSNGQLVKTLKSSTTQTGNLLYVDAVYGNNSTAQLNDFSKPYLTLAAAKAAATAGYTIMVRPGVYDGNDLLKDSVNWYFMPGAIVNAQPIYSNAMFGANSPVLCNVYGYGRFIDTLGGVSKIVEIGDAGANVYIECQSMDVGYGDFDVAITVSAGNLNCLVREFIESKEYDAIIISGGTAYIQADIIRATGAAEGSAIEIAGGTSTIKCRTYTSAGAYDAFGSCAAIYMTDGVCNVLGEGVSDLADGIVFSGTGAGSLYIQGSIKSTSRTAVYYKTLTTSKTLYAQGRIISNTSYDSIDAPEAQTIVSYGAFANKVYDANITVNGVLTIGSYVQ